MSSPTPFVVGLARAAPTNTQTRPGGVWVRLVVKTTWSPTAGFKAAPITGHSLNLCFHSQELSKSLLHSEAQLTSEPLPSAVHSDDASSVDDILFSILLPSCLGYVSEFRKSATFGLMDREFHWTPLLPPSTPFFHNQLSAHHCK